MHSEIGDVEVRCSKSGIPLYHLIKVDEKALNRSKILRNKSESELLRHANELAEEWDGKRSEVEDVRTGKRFLEKKLINEYNKIIIQILKITSKNIRIFKKIIR